MLVEYFYSKECEEKKFLSFLKGFEAPAFLKEGSSLADIDISLFTQYAEGLDPAESLSGKIMMSKPYLKTFYHNHQPEFKQLPGDVQLELLDKIKARNSQIVTAFRKMHDDRAADRSRTIMRLIALVLKNIQIRTGLPFADMKVPAHDAIAEIFPNADDIFQASQIQIAALTDDKHIKSLIKVFFVIRRNQDLSEISEYFRKEFIRYRKRAERAFAQR
ncbi:MAG: hypothetical protein ACRCUT_11645 [Spirochaetota bacterium]